MYSFLIGCRLTLTSEKMPLCPPCPFMIRIRTHWWLELVLHCSCKRIFRLVHANNQLNHQNVQVDFITVPGLELHGGQGGHCLHCPWYRPFVPLQKIPIYCKFFSMKVPFAKWKWPCPFKDEMSGLKYSTFEWQIQDICIVENEKSKDDNWLQIWFVYLWINRNRSEQGTSR